MPATLHAHQFTLPPNLRVALSNNFPTTDDAGKPAAIDPKVGVLQARAADGKPVFTVMSLAAHNQEVGHSKDGVDDISSDWPGVFAARLESKLGGMAMFLVGDNGSEEDPITVPELAHSDDPYPQATATGKALADARGGGRPVGEGAALRQARLQAHLVHRAAREQRVQGCRRRGAVRLSPDLRGRAAGGARGSRPSHGGQHAVRAAPTCS